MRIGLYALRCPKEKVEDRVWLIDHTITIGDKKCLVIVGCRLSIWQQDRRPLTHQDLELLGLDIVDHSDATVVAAQLAATAQSVGMPCSIVSDQGADLKGGIRLFQQQQGLPVRWNYDVTHKMATLVKQELAGNDAWKAYLKQCGQVRASLQQTSLAHLIPPTLKNKARYMNVEPQVRWGLNTLRYVERAAQQAPADPKVEEKLGWLRSYRERLLEWENLLEVVEATTHYVRHHGYHRGAEKNLEAKLATLARTDMARRVMDAAMGFMAEQSALAQPGEHLIGTTECLESLLGKIKQITQQNSKRGFTKSILAAIASVADRNADFIRKALSHITTNDVLQWCQDNLGRSLQSLRHEALTSKVPEIIPGTKAA